MSLALKAAEAANLARTDTRDKAKAKALDRDEKFLATFIEKTGFCGAKSLGCKKVDVIVERGDQWSRRQVRETRTWFFVEYDDVVFINELEGGKLRWYWNVQRKCDKCLHNTRAGTEAYPVGFGLPLLRSDGTRDETQDADLIKSIGMWLTAKTVCSECLADIPARCPTCLRTNK